MKLPGNRIRKSNGQIIKFRSAAARSRWERVAKAIKRGWKPKGRAR